MYGYISLYFKPNEKEKINYVSHYCSMCHSLKKEFGNFYRMFIVREVSFFSIMKIKFDEKKLKKIKCPWVGFKEKYIYQDLTQFEEFSFLNMLIIYGKVYDKLHDSNLKRLGLFLNNLRKRLIDYYGKEFILKYENILNMQFNIEKENLELEKYIEPSIDIIKLLIDRHKLELPEEFSIYVATLTYLFDALYDFEKDLKRKNFNPIKTVYGINKLSDLSCENIEYIDFMIDYSIKKILDIFDQSNINNKHFVKKIFSFSAMYHKSKLVELFSLKKVNKKEKNKANIYLKV
ncbi:hypothetical protein JCM30566_13020 [Marinitoga arctica]